MVVLGHRLKTFICFINITLTTSCAMIPKWLQFSPSFFWLHKTSGKLTLPVHFCQRAHFEPCRWILGAWTRYFPGATAVTISSVTFYFKLLDVTTHFRTSALWFHMRKQVYKTMGKKILWCIWCFSITIILKKLP